MCLNPLNYMHDWWISYKNAISVPQMIVLSIQSKDKMKPPKNYALIYFSCLGGFFIYWMKSIRCMNRFFILSETENGIKMFKSNI